MLSKIVGRCAATTDFWTAKHTHQSYISLTVHYFTPEWKLLRRILFVAHYEEENKTGPTVLHMLKTKAASIGIDGDNFSKLIFVTDQGPNLVCGLSGHTRYNCIVHGIDLVLKHAFDKKSNPLMEPIHNLIINSAVLVKYFKKSGKTEELPHPLISAAPTRFNTNFYMLSSVLQNFDTLDELLNISSPLAHNGHSDPEKRKSLFIDKNLLQEVIPFLERFNCAIKSLQFDTKPTFHEVALWVTTYFPKLFVEQDNDSDNIRHLRSICKTLFKEKVNLNKEHKFASFLNPPFKSLKFLTDDDRAGTYSLLKDKLRAMNIEDEMQNNNEANSESSPWDEYITSAELDPEGEFDMYLMCANLRPPTTLLEWWQKNEHVYPRLSRLAKQLLSIPCSNTTSERVFSDAGFTLHERRSNLNPNVVDKLMFLRSNLNNT